MKHLLLVLAISLFCQAINAQLNKGQWLAGGTAGFNYAFAKDAYDQSSYSNKTTELRVSPGAGYFLVDKLCVGVRPGIALSKNSFSSTIPIVQGYSSQTQNSKGTDWSIAPFVRYYFLPKKNKVNLLTEVSFAYTHSKTHTDNTGLYVQNGQTTPSGGSSDYKYNDAVYSISAGPAIFLNPKVALEITAGYSIINSKPSSPTQNTVSVSAGLQIHLDGKKR